MIRFRCTATAAAKVRADVVALPVWQEGDRARMPAGSALHRTLAATCKADRFRAAPCEVLLYHAPDASRYLVVGLGPEKGDALDAVRIAASTAARQAARLGARRLAMEVPAGGPLGSVEPLAIGQALAEGVLLGLYRFDRYRTEDPEAPSRLTAVEVLSPADRVRPIRDGLGRGELFAETTNYARDLVNEPPIALTPMRMATLARAEARRLGLHCRVLRRKEMESKGMGAFLGVARGSVEEPCLIHLRYRPAGKPRARVALVGKGITFDSGGLSLKAAANMLTMKCDMAGSAAVLSVLRALPELDLPVQVDGLMAMSENLPSGSAQKPGDIVRTMSGKTVEITNTDAEGRLVLADALAYAATLRPDRIIDLATLTGSVVVALGPLATGAMGTDQKMLDGLLASARASGEKMWPLPLYEDYLSMMRSPVADLKNSGERWGGSLTAGLFLREFVPKGLPWVHLDIAGPAFLEKDQPYLRRGGTGAGVRTLLHYLGGLD